MRRSAAHNLSWRWHDRHCRSSWVAPLHARNCSHYTICFHRALRCSFQIVLFISKHMKRIAKMRNLIYLYSELYHRKYLNKLLNIHEWMNENIWTTIRVSRQRPVARSVKAESTRCEIKGSSSHVRRRLFEVRKSVIYDIIRVQVSRTYNANITCLYPILTM